MGSVSDRLREERVRLGLNQTDFAAIAEQGKKSQVRYEAGERSPDANYLSAIANEGADITYILTGVRAAATLQDVAVYGDRRYNPQNTPPDAVLGHRSPQSASGDDLAEYVPVPLHEALLAAGAGAHHGEEIIDRLAFRRDWLQKINVPASAARLARVKGDSMFPTLFEGDVVMIDTGRREPPVLKRGPNDRRYSPIYAFAEGSDARIKRIERPAEDQLILLSDNPEYAPEFRSGKQINDMQIIGKVVWWGHTVRE